MLADALQRIDGIAEQLGIYAVEVYALTDAARTLYLKFGFQPLLDDTLHLYLPLKTRRKLLPR